MEFEAELVNGKLLVKPQMERKANGDLVAHMPSIPIIQKTIKEYKKLENNGKRDIQQI